jgi:predicted ArsR family transcriptional regulator
MDEAFGRRAATVAALADPLRRALYRFVAEQPGAVSRDQAAEGLELPRHTAKFHLDRLVDEGLLVAEFRRLTGRTGPGAGRTAKLYRRARKEVSVTLPSRRYDLAGQVLADAVERALTGTPMAEALQDAAGEAARVVAASYDETPSVFEALTRLGYEPRDDGGLRLGNCPYDRLAADHADLVCGVNERFVGSLCSALGSDDPVTRTRTGPGPTGCCVRIGARDATGNP